MTSGQDVKVDHNTIEHMKLINQPRLNLKIYLKKAILMERWTYFVNQPRLNLKMSLEKASLLERYFVKLFCTIILKEGRDIENLNSQYFRSTFSHIYLFGFSIRIHFSIYKLKSCSCVITSTFPLKALLNHSGRTSNIIYCWQEDNARWCQVIPGVSR